MRNGKIFRKLKSQEMLELEKNVEILIQSR